ncbi:uncharacterized protein LOC129581191 [Paramacrobiotus metropolitanus]|uniref:uncharacterized protein LOC129581191 n=1 Tax=Paramacrobiotus metropolitanus TaxID=2943436 RepID=UPI0024456E4C|nr:uncharacterized protein LOC129581191 [Paramacrobiotus metropolitanus]
MFSRFELWSFFALIFLIISGVVSYYTSRRCYGTGDCHLFTKNQDGGFEDAQHQWLVECNDGEGAVAIRDDDTHFEGISGVWCSFLFPLKESTRGSYPYYPSCVTRNLSAGEYHCRNAEQLDDANTTHDQLFVTGVYKEPDDQRVFIPSTMKCCETPKGYQIDHTRCYYKKTFDRFGEHYTGEWLVKCDTHHVVTGIGKDVNPWDNKEHFTWIQCCPFTYVSAPVATYSSVSGSVNPNAALVEQLTAVAGLTNLNDPKYMTFLSSDLLNYNMPTGLEADTTAAKDRDTSPLIGMARVDIPSEAIPQRYRNSPVFDPAYIQSRSGVDSDKMGYKYSTGTLLAELLRKQQFDPDQKVTPLGYLNPSMVGVPSSTSAHTGYGGFPADYYLGLNQYPNMLKQMQQLAWMNLTGQNFSPPTTTPEPIQHSQEISAIQHAANVAAYNQFLSTFNQLLHTYRDQKLKAETERNNNEQRTSVTFPGNQRSTSATKSDIMPPVAELRTLTAINPNINPLTTGIEDGIQQSHPISARHHYVPFPLPSGLQNYLLLASRNPTAALSQIYADEQLPIPTSDAVDPSQYVQQYFPTTPAPKTTSWKNLSGLEQLFFSKPNSGNGFAQKPVGPDFSRPITLDAQLANKWLEALLFKQTPGSGVGGHLQLAPAPLVTVPHYEGSLVYQMPVSTVAQFATSTTASLNGTYLSKGETTSTYPTISNTTSVAA